MHRLRDAIRGAPKLSSRGVRTNSIQCILSLSPYHERPPPTRIIFIKQANVLELCFSMTRNIQVLARTALKSCSRRLTCTTKVFWIFFEGSSRSNREYPFFITALNVSSLSRLRISMCYKLPVADTVQLNASTGKKQTISSSRQNN